MCCFHVEIRNVPRKFTEPSIQSLQSVGPPAVADPDLELRGKGDLDLRALSAIFPPVISSFFTQNNPSPRSVTCHVGGILVLCIALNKQTNKHLSKSFQNTLILYLIKWLNNQNNHCQGDIFFGKRDRCFITHCQNY